VSRSRPRAVVVTITEGLGLLPQAAFLGSALRELGFEPGLLPTDFCTTQDGFQTAIKEEPPAAVLFVDALEWREILVTLSQFACDAVGCPVVIASSVPRRIAPSGFPERVKFVAEGDGTGLARALGVGGAPPGPEALPLDYALFGGAAALDRAMTASLFGDLGRAALLAARGEPGRVSPTAALARLEAAVEGGPFPLSREAALAPLAALGAAVRSVEWWDRSWDPANLGLLDSVWKTGLRQSVRLRPDAATPAFLGDLKRRGVARVVFECDALEDAPDLRLPGAAGDAREVAEAARRCADAGLPAGVLLVVGLPGETAAKTDGRCDRLRASRVDRVRAVPFEPAGGTEAWDRLVARGWWPPKTDRWNRELYQPLSQPEAAEYPRVLEAALMLVADLEAACGART
jgi:hypothetical protein